MANLEDTVELMVEMYSRGSVELTKKVLTKMNKTDLVQRLSDISSETKCEAKEKLHFLSVKDSSDEQETSEIQRVETMTSVIELLLETLACLSNMELQKFKDFLQGKICFYIYHPRKLFMMQDMQDTVFLMVLTYGEKSVEVTKKVLEWMERNDLVQRLEGSSSGPKQKRSLDENLLGLIHKVATMRAVKELLLDKLKYFSSEELKKFKWLLQFTFFQKGLPHIPWSQLNKANKAHLVNLMMEMCGQQSVEMTNEVFMDMNRFDLLQKLPETSSDHPENHWPALILKVETMTSIIELLLETLSGLTDWELQSSNTSFKHFLLHQTDFYRHFSDTQLMLMNITDIVFLMVLTYGQQSVEKIEEVLKKMKRTDLVQRLSCNGSAAPSGSEKKHSDENQSVLIQRVATIAAYKELLLEILNDFSNEELKKFKEFLQLIVSQEDLPDISWKLRYTADRAQIVDPMVQTYGQQSAHLTREVLKKMERTDLMSKPIIPHSVKETPSVSEHRPALFTRAQKTDSAKQIVLGTLEDLSIKELKKFKWLLQFTYFKKGLPQISQRQLEFAGSADALVALMVANKQSVEVTREVLMDMNRRDLVERLPETSSGLKAKHQSEPLQKKVTTTSVQEKLLETLNDLSHRELEPFKWLLHRTEMKKGLQRISKQRMETADRDEVVTLMVENYGQQSVEVTGEFVKAMERADQVQRSPDFGSGFEGPSKDLESCGSIKQVSSDWLKLEPEVNSTDEATTYSLQSEAGSFECRVSGLRWVCKDKVSFKYQFCTWKGRVERIQYMPAGPLMDIKVIAGKLFEVYLPHWIYIEDNPTILDKFAVLHINDCGEVVEKVSEVTSSHVKLSEPSFSPRMALFKLGFPVEINCNMLIYKTDKTFLTLHVYLIPRDPELQQILDRKELSYGNKVIQKPHPEKPLRMGDRFILTANVDSAEIYPEKLMLRHKSTDSNFFEVHIEDADTNFKLHLTQENEDQPAWTCAIRKNDYQRTRLTQGAHFVDKHRCDLIDRVSNIQQILDDLLREEVIQQEDYDSIRAIPTTQEKMRKLYSGPLKAAGHAGKDVFFKILEKYEKYLVDELKRPKS